MNAQDRDRQMDHDLDRLLRGLSNPMPPAQLEQRVLARLEQRELERASSSTRSSWLAPRPLWAFAAAALVLTIAAIGLLTHRPAPRNVVSNGHPAPLVPNPAKVRVDPLPLAASNVTVAVTPHAAPTRTPSHRNALRSATVQPALQTAEAPALDAATCHCDPVALAEASAPSHPAPPLPLTRAERHMLLILRSGETEELAALDPYLRDLEFQRERADFYRFFAPPQPASTIKPASTPTSTQGNDQP